MDNTSIPQGTRILLAEDDEINAVTVERLLQKMGCRVSVAQNGQEVLTLLSKDDFDLILMDIQMPVMDGVEATKCIRQSGEMREKARIPIIAITSYAMKGDREEFLKAGMDEYISKPVEMKELARKISGLVQKNPAG